MRIAEKIKMGKARRISRLNAVAVVQQLAAAGAFNIVALENRPRLGRERRGKTLRDHKSGSWAARFANRAARHERDNGK